MSETPQEMLAAYLASPSSGALWEIGLREAIRALLAENAGSRRAQSDCVKLGQFIGSTLDGMGERDSAADQMARMRLRAEKAEAEVAEYRAEGMVPAGAWAHDLEQLKKLEAELRRAEQFWASAQERADVANVALLDAVRVRGQLRAAEAALRSIASNTCCEGCGEAARVARATLYEPSDEERAARKRDHALARAALRDTETGEEGKP